MKHAVILSLTVLIAVLLLSTIQTGSSAPPESPPLTDSDIRFTVLTDTGILSTTMADYLPGVLAGEMPALFASEALMAQAVAARTYILYRMAHGSAAHPEADICNSPSCCKAYVTEDALRSSWGSDYDTYLAKVTAAVTDTDGRYLTYGGDAIEAVFHSSSAGATEASGSIWNDRDYLISVASPETAADVPNYVTEVTFTPDQLKTALYAKYPNMALPDDPAVWLGDMTLNDSGRVRTLTAGGLQLTGAQVRSALGLRSSAFTVDYADGVFTFTVTGYGHGVGMSQYGANVYAKQGWGYAEILAHYYPGTQLTSAAG